MNLNVYQECRSAEGWQPIKVASGSQENVVYTVLVNPWGSTQENMCECKSYMFRGYCKHQQEAMNHVCSWREGGLWKEVQTESEKSGMICPKCGGPTKWQMEVKEN